MPWGGNELEWEHRWLLRARKAQSYKKLEDSIIEERYKKGSAADTHSGMVWGTMLMASESR